MSSSRMGAILYQASPKLLVFVDWPFDSQARGSMMARRKGQDCLANTRSDFKSLAAVLKWGNLQSPEGKREWHRRMMKGR